MNTHTLEAQSIGNQVPDLINYNLYSSDPALQKLVQKLAAMREPELIGQGAVLGSAEIIQLAEDANRYPPELQTFTRTGNRIDSVKFHPAWHQIMSIARRHGTANWPFADTKSAGWVAFGAAQYMHSQIESGSLCPSTMTQACIPVLQKETELFKQLSPKLYSMEHDARDIPWQHKTSMTVGMGMTEKQGGSDVRTNISSATPYAGQGRGAEYLINGHKWFFSAPMCDAHLVLAKTDNGHSCFFVPRWKPDGEKNPIHIQRLKNKVGNQSNSSSEVEFHDAWGIMVGEEGRGIPTIIEMASYTRANCALGSAGFIRQAFAQAHHYARHRSAFGSRLIDKPVMARVLADMALEAEAAMTFSLVLANQFSHSTDVLAQAWRRMMTPVAKFWICKRAVEVCGEAMEVFGGNGYVDDGPMGRLFRDAPVNSIWEGSGNVMCLDVLRAVSRNPQDASLVLDHMEQIAAQDSRLIASLNWLRTALTRPPEQLEMDARLITQKLALLAQACLLREHAHPDIAEAFIASRTDPDWGAILGSSSFISDPQKIIALSWQD